MQKHALNRKMFADGFYYIEEKDTVDPQELIDEQIAKLRADLEYFLEFGDESIFDDLPGADIEIQVRHQGPVVQN